MKCPVCKTEMKLRSGMFGPFHYCRQHGTLSVQGNKLFCTGNIAGYFSRHNIHATAYQYTSLTPRVDLEFETRKQAMMFGVDINELDRFIEGGEDTANDDPDHWMNLRPY